LCSLLVPLPDSLLVDGLKLEFGRLSQRVPVDQPPVIKPDPQPGFDKFVHHTVLKTRDEFQIIRFNDTFGPIRYRPH
jgi:hypothetical protein